MKECHKRLDVLFAEISLLRRRTNRNSRILEKVLLQNSGKEKEQTVKTESAGLTPEKIDQLADKFYDKIMEKMDAQDFTTESVHEDIRILHHLVKLKDEVEPPVILGRKENGGAADEI